ncbi:tetratricopeptide repeat protein [Candidatus Sumerlaeota bacterium]|nr:tetratricopeptide repeat protein [Candidatus Sumerlaeota bacterium]
MTPGEQAADAALAKKQTLWFLGIVALCAIIPFLHTLNFQFLNWDDDRYVLRNPFLGSVTWGKLQGVLTSSYYFNYHPITMLSYMVNFAVSGMHPAGYRAVNILLHACACMGVFMLLVRMEITRTASLFLALLFAVHPLRLESVVWISERKDVLCGALYVWALVCWVASGKKFPALSVLLFVLALGAKAMAISFPLVVLWHDLLLRRTQMRERIPAYALLLGLSVLFAWLNMSAQEHAISAQLSMLERLKLATFAPTHYAMTTFWPLRISPLYPVEFRPSAHSLGLIGGLLTCIGGLAAVVRYWKRNPLVSFGLLAAATALAPVSGLIAVGSAFAADRYSYIPTIPLLLALGPFAMRASSQRIGRIILGVIVLGYFTSTIALSRTWSDSVALWERVLKVYPESIEGRRNLADAWSIRAVSSPADAQRYYEKALEIFPADGKAIQFRGDALIEAQQWKEAEAVMKSALAETEIRSIVKSYALAMSALCAHRLGKLEEANALAKQAFDPAILNPQAVDEFVFIGYTAGRIGRFDVTDRYYSAALEREPSNTEVLQQLAFLRMQQKRPAEALQFIERAAAISPADPSIQHNLSLVRQEAAKMQ